MPAAALRLRVTPRGGRSGVDRWDGEVLHVRVSAPPADGAANRAVIEVVSDAIGVPRSRVALRSGAASRHKVLAIDGIEPDALLARLQSYARTEGPA